MPRICLRSSKVDELGPSFISDLNDQSALTTPYTDPHGRSTTSFDAWIFIFRYRSASSWLPFRSTIRNGPARLLYSTKSVCRLLPIRDTTPNEPNPSHVRPRSYDDGSADVHGRNGTQVGQSLSFCGCLSSNKIRPAEQISWSSS